MDAKDRATSQKSIDYHPEKDMHMDARILAEYKKQRAEYMSTGARFGRDTGAALAALSVAKQEVALQDAESSGRIRFEWHEDMSDWDNPDWTNAKYADNPKEAHQFRTWARQRDRAMEEGRYTYEYCLAQVPGETIVRARDTSYEWREETWVTVAGLHGVELDIDDTYNYRREIERELFEEAFSTDTAVA